MVRRERHLTEFGDLVVGDVRRDAIIADNFNFLDSVRGAEAVERVEHGVHRVDSGEVRADCEVHSLLDVRRDENRDTGLAAGHNVRLVAMDGQSVRGDGASSHVQDQGEVFRRYFVEIRDH